MRRCIALGVAGVVLVALLACLFIGLALHKPIPRKPGAPETQGTPALATTLPPGPTAQAPGTAPTKTSTRPVLAPDKLFEFASPAVVKLVMLDDAGKEIGSASGFIIAIEKKRTFPHMTVVTNYHAVRPAVSIDVLLASGECGEVEGVLSEDEAADVAILDASQVGKKPPTRALEMACGPDPPVGARVYAIGSPKGLSNTLSEGLISGYRDRGDLERWIQITAPISPGSSGGPLLDATGAFLGVTTGFLQDGQNLNFAVPAKEVARLLNTPRGARELWEGSSISKTRQHTFMEAKRAFWERSEKYSANGEKYLDDQVEAGDQLALLVSYLRKDHPFAPEALDILKLAMKAKPGKYAYLVYYCWGDYAWLRFRDQIYLGKAIEEQEDPIPILKHSEELNTEFAPTADLLCETYLYKKMNPEALAEAQLLVRLMPRYSWAYLYRGQAWAAFGRREQCDKDFAKAIEFGPNEAYLYSRIGLAYLQEPLDDASAAAQAFERAVELDPDHSLYYEYLGTAYEQLGEHDKALAAHERARKLEKK